MHKKILSSQLIVVICFMAVYFAPLFSQDYHTCEAETWTMISNYLDCFLADPIANFALLERVDDLSYWTSIYYMINKKSYIKELFAKQFPVSDIDEGKLDSIFRLLKAYSSTTSYEMLRPIISRIIEISSMKPEWFARNLLRRDDRRELARLIVKADIEYIFGQRKGLKDILSDLRDLEIIREMTDLFNDLDYEAQKEIERFKEFMKDPAGNLDNIKDIYNLCAAMGEHDYLFLDEKKTLWPKDNSILILQDWIRNDIDERKIKVLFHLMNHCDSAYHQDVINGIALDVFIEHQPLFVSALKEEPNWRSIMFRLRYDFDAWEKHFNKTISIRGNSDFEMKIKSQLEFLRKNLDYEY